LSLSALAGPKTGKVVAFKDSAEAGVLRNAYLILAAGDHDYKGHLSELHENVPFGTR
jgi:hypothetical protein